MIFLRSGLSPGGQRPPRHRHKAVCWASGPAIRHNPRRLGLVCDLFIGPSLSASAAALSRERTAIVSILPKLIGRPRKRLRREHVFGVTASTSSRQLRKMGFKPVGWGSRARVAFEVGKPDACPSPLGEGWPRRRAGWRIWVSNEPPKEKKNSPGPESGQCDP